MNIPEKAPWEMTREEINHVFLRLAENIQRCDMMYRAWQFARPAEVTGKDAAEKKMNFNLELHHRKQELEKAEKLRQRYRPLRHKLMIQEAVKAGKRIPDAVLKEYPDLVAAGSREQHSTETNEAEKKEDFIKSHFIFAAVPPPQKQTDTMSHSKDGIKNEPEVEKQSKSQKILAEINASIEQLAKNIEAPETEQTIKKWLAYQSNFHTYSLNNTFFLYLQAMNRGTDISDVLPFRKWVALKGDNGEKVSIRKGERAYHVICPVEKKVYEKDEDGKYKLDENGKTIQARDPKTGEPLTYLWYTVGCVFDVSQTNAREIGAVKELDYKGKAVPINPETVQEVAQRITEKFEIPVYFENEPMMKAGGWYTPHTHCIVINTAVTKEDAHQLGTLFHELGHALIHGRKSPQYDRRLKEGQAEAFAYAASSAFGVERNSQLYIKSWIENEVPLQDVLKDISSHVQKAFKELDLAELAAQNLAKAQAESPERKSASEIPSAVPETANQVEQAQKTIESMRVELYNSMLATSNPAVFAALRYVENAPEEKIAGLYSVLKEARSDNLSEAQTGALLEMKIREIKQREQRRIVPEENTAHMTFGF